MTHEEQGNLWGRGWQAGMAVWIKMVDDGEGSVVQREGVVEVEELRRVGEGGGEDQWNQEARKEGRTIEE